MTWYDPRTWLPNSDDHDTTTLYNVEWDVEKTHPEVTRRIVWENGVERTITYIEDGWLSDPHNTVQAWVDAADADFRIESTPAYTEVVERVEDAETYTETRSTWVEHPVPDGVEKTGEQKTVRIEDE